MEQALYNILKNNRGKRLLGKFLVSYLPTKRQLFRLIKKISRSKKISISILLSRLFGKSWKNAIFLFPTKGLIDSIVMLIKKYNPKTILELSAGHGLMSYVLMNELKKINWSGKYMAFDNFSYKFDKKSLYVPVKKLSNDAALKKYLDEKTFVLAFYPGNFAVSRMVDLINKYKIPKSSPKLIYVGWPQNYNSKSIVNKDILSIWSFIRPGKWQFPNSTAHNNRTTDFIFISTFKKLK